MKISLVNKALENSLVENFTQKPKNTKRSRRIHCYADEIVIAWQMLNDSHNNTGAQAMKIIRNYEYWNN